MTRPKIDEELKQISAAVEAIKAVPAGRRNAVLEYLNSRFLDEPLVMLHDDDSDQDESAGWPATLGAEPQPGDES